MYCCTHGRQSRGRCPNLFEALNNPAPRDTSVYRELHTSAKMATPPLPFPPLNAASTSLGLFFSSRLNNRERLTSMLMGQRSRKRSTSASFSQTNASSVFLQKKNTNDAKTYAFNVKHTLVLSRTEWCRCCEVKQRSD